MADQVAGQARSAAERGQQRMSAMTEAMDEISRAGRFKKLNLYRDNVKFCLILFIEVSV
jgi:hypothetical protein